MQTNQHEPSSMEYALTLLGTAGAIAALLAIGNLAPDMFLAMLR